MVELVIKISKDSYEATCNGHMLPPDVENVVNAIKNGTLLPEHHGRLIDKDKMIADLLTVNPQFQYLVDWGIQVTEAQPTIIEAECTYRETGCGSCKRQLDCPIEADKGVLDKINEKQDSLRVTCKAWDEAISRDGYVD